MKYVRFYLEHDSKTHKRLNDHNGNVIAVLDTMGNGFIPYEQGSGTWGWETMSAVYFYPNSPVASGSASEEYISSHCKRISDSRAREIHPNLFVRLDENIE
jgi:hypothetical protein